MAPNSIPGGGLSVIALVSGGKDSFFSALHCLENGHRLVALANLHPPAPQAGPESSDSTPPASLARATAGTDHAHDDAHGSASDSDLNSFMYQTVGHQVIPLYAEATGIPLYRHAISGGAVQSGRDYSTTASFGHEDDDETESMIPLLQSVLRNHPEANALSAGAILSTYQRTRVESVALRLGLTPLAYLWKYPVLPQPLSTGKDEAQLLFDMAATGLEARIIKVASGGLDESFLWESVTNARTIMRLKKAMSRFGSAGGDTGAVIGEGGEFETLVVDGPSRVFKKRIVVPESARITVKEGGGTAWLSFGTATLEEKEEGEEDAGQLRRPDLLDERFAAVLEALQMTRQESIDTEREYEDEALTGTVGGGKCDVHAPTFHQRSNVETWAFTGSQENNNIHEETKVLIGNIQKALTARDLKPSSILSTVIILRSMTDFPAINAIYGSLFPDPNPPSRVTISCGSLIPPSSGNIAVYVTLSTSSTSNLIQRDGLHVQSRSYWAPANIGPYSQAITFSTSSPSSPHNRSPVLASKIVHIAGQIPLVPASMEFCPMKEENGSDGLDMQLVLSLQHLWRIGIEMNVSWWTSAAVFFPASRPEYYFSARDKALLAWRAWKEAHEWKMGGGDAEDDDEDGPDLWDRKFNPMYMSYAAGEATAGGDTDTAILPDYSFFDGDDHQEATAGGGGGRRPKERPLPYFFAVEVDELPRSAEAEWSAHAGLSGMASTDSLSVARWRGRTSSAPSHACEVDHCILTSTIRNDDDDDDDDDDDEKQDREVFVCVHSIVATETTPSTATKMSLTEALTQADKAWCASLSLGHQQTQPAAGKINLPPPDGGLSKPYLVYVDTEEFGPEDIAGAMNEEEGGSGLAVVPCRSIYGGGATARRVGMVVLYRHFLSSRLLPENPSD